MNKYTLRHLFLTFMAVLLLGSCRITEPYNTPTAPAANLYRDVITTDTTSLGSLHLKELFADTTLQRLISEGIAQNLDLQVAYTRIKLAQAYYSQSRAALLPTLNANAGATRSRLPEAQDFRGQGSTTQYQLGLSSGWELDVWGRLRSNRRANLASLLQSEAGARAVQTSLVANIANNYLLLMALDQQLDITRLTVANWDTTVQTMQALKEAARVTEAAVVQSEAQRYAVEVTIPDLQQSIRETENALSILLGRPPTAIARGRLENQTTPSNLQTGIPAQLLANRPDVLQAELNYRYFFELTNVARASFYPNLTITSSAGFSALALTDLLDPGALAISLGAGLAQPIFNGRLNRTRLEVARAQQQEAALGFQNTLLNAGREVSDALYSHQTALQKIQVRTYQIDALQKSVSYTQELVRYGFSDYVELITARQNLLQAQLGSVNDRLQQLQSVVNLYRSLGGGWQ